MNVKRSPEEKAARAAAARAGFPARAARLTHPPRPPEPERCLICKRLMPPEWLRQSPQDDPVCPACDARPLRRLTGWAGYAGHCPDVSGDDSGWDNIVRIMEEQA